jgi:hypothetical protein
MVYNTQNYWVFGLCPSSDILETRGFWRCIILRITGFLDRVHRPVFKKLENAAFRKLDHYSSFFYVTQQSRCLSPQLRTEADIVSETLHSLVLRIPEDGKSSKTQ